MSGALHKRTRAREARGVSRDTVIVPAHEEGFKQVFLGQDCWYALRISEGMLDKVRYIAVYQIAPVRAITHYAEVHHFEPYGEDGKFRVVFSGKAMPIGPIPYGAVPTGSMQGPRYTNIAKLRAAKTFADLLK